MTLGAKNEKNVAVKYIIPKDIAPNDSIHHNDAEKILQMGTTKFCTVFDPKIRFQCSILPKKIKAIPTLIWMAFVSFDTTRNFGLMGEFSSISR